MAAVSKQPVTLVTGGGGFLGGAIVRMLLARGDRVRSFSRSTYAGLAALGVEQIQGDLEDTHAVQKACTGVSTVFHVAAKAGVWGAWNDFYRPNVIGTLNIIDACKRCHVARLIYTSSPSVIYDGQDMENADESVPYPASFHHHYPKTKAMAEQAVRKAAAEGLPSVILRPHLIWGPGDTHIVPGLLSRAHRLRQIGDGANVVDTIYIDNAAQAHLLADAALAERPDLSGRVYFISQDDPIPVWQMINAILHAGGKPPIRKTISFKAAYVVGAIMEGVYRLFRLKGEPPMTRWGAGELASTHWFNIEAAKKDLGYRPLISTEEGLKRLEAWLQTNPI
jgi:nucleoside-diphosphate-sugar epimerase